MSGLHIRADAPWRADLVSECLRFPAGVHDDQVDALGLIGQLLNLIVAPRRTEEPSIQKQSGYRAMSKPSQGASWRLK